MEKDSLTGAWEWNWSIHEHHFAELESGVREHALADWPGRELCSGGANARAGHPLAQRSSKEVSSSREWAAGWHLADQPRAIRDSRSNCSCSRTKSTAGPVVSSAFPRYSSLACQFQNLERVGPAAGLASEFRKRQSQLLDYIDGRTVQIQNVNISWRIFDVQQLNEKR